MTVSRTNPGITLAEAEELDNRLGYPKFNTTLADGTPAQVGLGMLLYNQLPTVSEKNAIEDVVGDEVTDLVFAAATELTIASGVITTTQAAHTVDTQSDAASDDLDTINGMSAEELVFIRPASPARTVVIKHGTGNIFCPGGQDISLAEATDWALLGSDGTNVIVIAKSTLASVAAAPAAHASNHVNGTDDIQDATAGQKGLMTAAYATKLDGIETAADVTDLANVTGSLGATAAAAVATSAGGGDDGKLAKLDPNGRWDISMMPETVIKEATVALSTANILALHTTPIELVPSPAAGLYNEFLGATVRASFGTTALNDAAAQGNLRIKTGTSTQSLAVTEADGVVDVAVGTEVRHVRPAAPAATQDYEAQQEAIVIDNDGGAFTDPGGADTTMLITTRYRVLSLV